MPKKLKNFCKADLVMLCVTKLSADFLVEWASLYLEENFRKRHLISLIKDELEINENDRVSK